ncbi:MAG: epoxyqueuosine reductase [Methanomassiliicoccaceae archaeon]|nr:epoxyqueuosine reductase [Methanomassiliicoccaceae archaeon]
MAGDALWERVRAVARSMGITDMAVADAGAWEADDFVREITPKIERPSSIMQGARSVIVIGMPVQRTILATSPSTFYSEHNKTVGITEDIVAQRVVMELHIEGYAAISVSRDGYQWNEELRRQMASFFSHRHAAYLAGMGTFGMNNMLLTEKNGPRVRLTSVITTAELPFGKPMEKQLCTKCMRCVNECPEGATASELYPNGITKKRRCLDRATILRDNAISPCARCTFVCPVGADAADPLPTDEAVANIRRYGSLP